MNTSDRKTHAFDDLTQAYETPVSQQTNNTASTYRVLKGGGSLQYGRARYTVTLAAAVQHAQLNTEVAFCRAGIRLSLPECAAFPDLCLDDFETKILPRAVFHQHQPPRCQRPDSRSGRF